MLRSIVTALLICSFSSAIVAEEHQDLLLNNLRFVNGLVTLDLDSIGNEKDTVIAVLGITPSKQSGLLVDLKDISNGSIASKLEYDAECRLIHLLKGSLERDSWRERWEENPGTYVTGTGKPLSGTDVEKRDREIFSPFSNRSLKGAPVEIAAICVINFKLTGSEKYRCYCIPAEESVHAASAFEYLKSKTNEALNKEDRQRLLDENLVLSTQLFKILKRTQKLDAVSVRKLLEESGTLKQAVISRLICENDEDRYIITDFISETKSLSKAEGVLLGVFSYVNKTSHRKDQNLMKQLQLAYDRYFVQQTNRGTTGVQQGLETYFGKRN